MSVVSPGDVGETEVTRPEESFTLGTLSGEDSDMNVQPTGVASYHPADTETSPKEDHGGSFWLRPVFAAS